MTRAAILLVLLAASFPAHALTWGEVRYRTDQAHMRAVLRNSLAYWRHPRAVRMDFRGWAAQPGTRR